MTTAELMALAVLRGDLDAARGLADHLMNDLEGTKVHLPAVKKFPMDLSKLRFVFYADTGCSGNVQINRQSLLQGVEEWLRGDTQVLGLIGVERMEVYELP